MAVPPASGPLSGSCGSGVGDGLSSVKVGAQVGLVVRRRCRWRCRWRSWWRGRWVGSGLGVGLVVGGGGLFPPHLMPVEVTITSPPVSRAGSPRSLPPLSLRGFMFASEPSSLLTTLSPRRTSSICTLSLSMKSAWVPSSSCRTNEAPLLAMHPAGNLMTSISHCNRKALSNPFRIPTPLAASTAVLYTREYTLRYLRAACKGAMSPKVPGLGFSRVFMT